ncbi:Rba50p [Lachancea thermotolerans CBS 6340]|uniref:KLTH0F00858p n=1 Tax=Lachancea thermotolerans (strain ATCC 56472 / CBS 6340 / NRRL Y-8284) TaxID=559295 RepID=C5DK08_LACTC|nr:KLTH0F00858p [Lachancea thermotolerans CBS 6340]CAR23809.1 KLTH0F00858p [Lachancea thermotolerans CBS 6340]
MDLLGDIVEKDVSEAPALHEAPPTGFPALYQPEKVSSWKVRLQQKNKQKRTSQTSKRERDTPAKRAVEEPVIPPETEAQRIHQENVTRMRSMTPEQLEQERRELLESLDPAVLHGLLKRAARREEPASLQESMKTVKAPLFAEVEGAPGTWVGGSREFSDLPHLDDAAVDKALGIPETKAKHVKFQDQDDESRAEFPGDEEECFPEPLPDDDMAPQEYQFVQQMDHMNNEDLLKDVHFIRPNTVDNDFEALDINDPSFDEKLHKKYFPDLPKESDKMAWMKPVSSAKPTGLIEDVTQCRFDFQGSLVPPDREIKSTQDGLHHHSEEPELAGYTIVELQHLSRSTFPAQRCIAIQTLGRILYKLGKQSYNQLIPEVDAGTYEEMGGAEAILNHIYGMFWDLCKVSMVIESLTDAADENSTKNLSVRNYAIDALWLWKEGGGDFRTGKNENK